MLAALAPPLYVSYMRLVERTGTVVREGYDEMLARRRAGANITLAVLHQDLLLSASLFRDLGIWTVAGLGDAGDIITAVLERCGFHVMRGGSSSGRSRRATVIFDLIARTRGGDGARGSIVAITPDGSRGPAGAIKPGVAFVSMKTGAEIYCLNIHASRALYMPTWDRTAIPLPFGELRVVLEGPITIAPRASRAEMEECRLEIERRLHAMHARAFARYARAPKPQLTPLAAAPPGHDKLECSSDTGRERAAGGEP